VNGANGNNFLSLNDRDGSSLGDQNTKCLGGVAVLCQKLIPAALLPQRYSPEAAVSSLVDLPCSQNTDVTLDGALHVVGLSVEDASFAGSTSLDHDGLSRALDRRSDSHRNTASHDGSVDTSRGVESRDTCTTSSNSLRKSSLRTKLDADLSRKILLLEHLVVTKI